VSTPNSKLQGCLFSGSRVSCTEGTSARRRLGLRAEKRASGACLAVAAFAGVHRTPCADQGQPPGEPLRQWRIPANADRTACDPFFDLTLRAVRIAGPRCAAGPTCLRRATRRSRIPNGASARGAGMAGARARCGQAAAPARRSLGEGGSVPKNGLEAFPSAEAPLSSQACTLLGCPTDSLPARG
jgi:hypothetical protein